MRTAEQIVGKVSSEFTGNNAKHFYEQLVNEARKEAIEEMIKYMDDHSMKGTGTYRHAIQLRNHLK